MKKLYISIILTALLAFAMGLYLPWWTIAVSAFLVAVVVQQGPQRAFWSGFAGIFLLWMILCIFITTANDGILAQRMAAVLPLGGSAFLLIFAAATVGGLVGGMGALTGSLLRKKDVHGRTA